MFSEVSFEVMFAVEKFPRLSEVRGLEPGVPAIATMLLCYDDSGSVARGVSPVPMLDATLLTAPEVALSIHLLVTGVKLFSGLVSWLWLVEATTVCLPYFAPVLSLTQ